MSKLKPYDTKVTDNDLTELVSLYEELLEEELERFDKIASEPFNFEQNYALIGSQGSINGLRKRLYFLKRLLNKEQIGIIYGEQKPKRYQFVTPLGKLLFKGQKFTLEEIEFMSDDVKSLIELARKVEVE